MSLDGELAEDYAELITETCIDFAAAAFFIYDFAITFDREVRYFWRRRFSVASALFLTIRYFSLLQAATVVLLVWRLIQGVLIQGCKVAEWMDIVFRLSIDFPLAVFSGARMYALCRSPLIAGITAVLSLGPLCVNCAVYTFKTSAFDTIFGCELVTAKTITREDTIVNYLFRIFNGGDDDSGSNLVAFTDPLTAILIYRFIIDLQKANEDNIRIGSDDPEMRTSVLSQSSLGFVDQAIGSLGSIIVPGIAAADDEYGDIADDDLQPSYSGEGDDRSVAPDGTLSQPGLEMQEAILGPYLNGECAASLMYACKSFIVGRVECKGY
ncbi:hypothetical protein C8Q80DRAFT_1121541 [Daedaleopsis nitida]|nr:hypothetical protein C8Q80DRAFT_1121541 [Daedaleopsis nitida]